MPQWAQNLVAVAKFGGTNLESSYALSWLLAVKHPRAALLVFHTFRNQSVVSKTNGLLLSKGKVDQATCKSRRNKSIEK